MKRTAIVAALSVMLVSAISVQTASACTDFMIKAKDGSCINGRSMEWGLDLKSQVCLYKRGEERWSQTPDGKKGVSWTSRYGYLGLDAHDVPLVVDGMNEKGLSLGLLWLPGTVYQEIPAGSPEVALSILDVGHWMLGNFTTVEEVKAAIGKVRVWAPSMADWGGNPTAHFAIHDAQGHNAVIEFVDGQQKIYDNPAGVLTNAPTFDWQRTNLRNYISLVPDSGHEITIKGTVLAPAGQGGGFLGIPGDWTPPSRFVRTSAMLGFAAQPENATEGVSLATHIMNAVDIPYGDIRDKTGGTEHSDYTQWILIKDLSNKILYFRSYDNSTLRAIDLNKLNFDVSAKSHRLTPVYGGKPSLDITAEVSPSGSPAGK